MLIKLNLRIHIIHTNQDEITMLGVLELVTSVVLNLMIVL